MRSADAGPEPVPPARDSATVFVVPCYDEAERLDREAIRRLADEAGIGLLLVDDGSRDGTGDVLDALAADHGDIDVLALGANRGKSEAVRLGLLRAADRDVEVVGYFDADLATPVDELLRLHGIAHARTDVDVVIASRVALLGHDIKRSVPRHYLGRLFATAASLVLATRVYDTQCGAKLFRNTPELRAALATPFLGRWSFDVELLGRMVFGDAATAPVPRARLLEVPLLAWRDVGGSKLTPRAAVAATLELAAVARSIRRRGSRRPV